MTDSPADLTTTDNNLQVSDRAMKRVAEIIKGEPSGTMLRVSVEGGGCSGFSYKFDLVNEKNSDDYVIERDGAIILVDETSLQFMGGSEIDFVNELIGASFQIKNPNATASCGCGTSFSL